MAGQGSNQDQIDWEIVRRATGFIVAVLLAGSIWVSLHPEYGEWTAYTRPVPYIAGGLLIVYLVIRMLVGRRSRQRERMASALVPLFGSEWDTKKDFAAFRYSHGVPMKIKANYPNDLPDYDPLWRLSVEETTRKRMDAFAVDSKWDHLKGRVSITAQQFKNAIDHEVAKRQDRSKTRISNIVSHHMRSEVRVNISEWMDVGDAMNAQASGLPLPESFTVKYPETATVSAHQKRTLEIKLALKLGGRWNIEVDSINDSFQVTPKYDFPDLVRHPGTAIYNEETSFGMLYYCVDENGVNRGWRVGQNSTMPHCVVVGATGGGKTTFMRSLLVGAVLQGIPVYGCDPKRVELRPFQDFPGVGGIASSAEQIAELISEMFDQMMYRYEIIEQHPELKTKFVPILFLVDELLILMQMANKLKVKMKAAKLPFDDPAELIQQLLALARTASIHIVIGVQRPDAELFGKGARDNLRHRVSLMRLSREGAMMMWENPFTGLDLPLKQGRAITNLDGGAPVEGQTFWISEPGAAKGVDEEILEEIRVRAEKKFFDFKFPIDPKKYALVPGELSKGAQRILDQMDIPLGASEDVYGVPEGQFAAEEKGEIPTQAVNAGSLTEGDTIHLDGVPAIVRDIEATGEIEDDQVSLLLEINGEEEYIVMEATERIDREFDLEDVMA